MKANLVGHRKFIIAVMALVFGTGLCAMGRLSGTEYVYLTGGVFGIFGAANVMSKRSPGGGPDPQPYGESHG